MTSISIRLEEMPEHDDVHVLGDQLAAFNAQTTGHNDGRELAIFLRDSDSEIVGGLYGWTWAGWLEIRYLWVHETLRGQGYGRRLLIMAEDEARARGCSSALLDSFSFQAPDFYRRLGYEEIATLREFPARYHRAFFTKAI